MNPAADRDAANPLAGFAGEFFGPPGKVYFDGNSLGLMPRRAEEALARRLTEWRELAVEGWTEAGWFEAAERTAGRLAPLLGLRSGEVAVTGSTTINLHQLLATFYRPQRGREALVTDALAFPSDAYAARAHVALRGLPGSAFRLVPSADGRTLDPEAVCDALTDDVAAAVLPTVVYGSGQLLPVAAIERHAREQGVTVLWDASHSAGAVAHRFADEGVRLVFGCGYKYLNGGPGAVGFLGCERDLAETVFPGLAGWWGHDKATQFQMAGRLTPASGAGRFQIGTPHLLSLAPLDASLEIFERAGIGRVREVSQQLTGALIEAVDRCLPSFSVVTPRPADARGGHVALRHPRARAISGLARGRFGLVGDFRPPDLIRLAPVALYNTFAEVARAVEILAAAEAEAPVDGAGHPAAVT